MYAELPAYEEAVHQYHHEMTAVEIIYLFIVERKCQAPRVCMIESHIDIVCCTSRTVSWKPFHCLTVILACLFLLVEGAETEKSL
jgi:hypothetical protein